MTRQPRWRRLRGPAARGACPRCGHPRAGGSFCGRCGAQLTAPGHPAGPSGGRVARRRAAGAPRRPGLCRGWRRGLLAGGVVAVGLVTLALRPALAPSDEVPGDEVHLPDEAPDASADAGTGPTPGPSPAHRPEPTFACLVEVDCVRWEADVADLEGTDGVVVHARAAGDDLLLVRGTRGFAVLDADGERRWDAADLGIEVAGEPPRALAADDLVLVVDDGELLAVDAASGTPRWRVPVPHRPPGPWHAVRVPGAVLTVGTESGQGGVGAEPPEQTVRAHDEVDGRVRWEETAARVIAGTPVVLVDDDVRGVAAATGETRWRREIRVHVDDPHVAGPAFGPFGSDTDELVAVPHVAEGDGELPLVLLDGRTGDEVARVEGRVVWRDADVTVVAERGRDARLLGVDADQGVRWARPMAVEGGGCCPRATGSPDAVLIDDQSREASFELVDPRDGRTLGTGGIAAEVAGALPLDTRTALVTETEREGPGPRIAIDLRDGTRLWSVEDAIAVPYLLDGAVLVAVEGALLAVEHDPRAPDDRP